jgi:hypothetical protein
LGGIQGDQSWANFRLLAILFYLGDFILWTVSLKNTEAALLSEILFPAVKSEYKV